MERLTLDRLGSYSPPKLMESVRDYLVARNGSRRTVSPRVRENLELLQREGLSFVVTGQQAGLFGGPLLTFYKTLTAVALAEKLSRERSQPVLPLFWVQSEDHDLEEIRTASFFDAELRSLSPFSSASENRKSISEISLPTSIDQTLGELRTFIEREPFAEWVLGLLQSSYQPGRGLNLAFSEFLEETFASTGLLFLDPRDALFRSHLGGDWSHLMRKAFLSRDALERCIRARSESIKNAVHVREHSPLFFLSDTEGDRFRLEEEKGGGRFVFVGKYETVEREELEQLLSKDPFRFTTSALLRPLFQDALLPTLGYVGGVAELQYHRQLDDAYLIFERTPPLLVARAQFRLIDEKRERLMQGLEILGSESYRSEGELVALLREQGKFPGRGSAAVRADIAPHLEQIFQFLGEEYRAVDPTLEKPFQKTRDGIDFALNQFFSRSDRAGQERLAVLNERIEKVRAFLFPNGSEQERILSLPFLLAKRGPESIQALLPKALDSKMQDIFLSRL